MRPPKPPHPEDPDDMSSFWKARREQGQVKRSKNRESSPAVLARAGVVFESKNDGAHLIVQGFGEIIDFWPGTGKWIPRGQKNFQVGVFKLMKRIKG